MGKKRPEPQSQPQRTGKNEENTLKTARKVRNMRRKWKWEWWGGVEWGQAGGR